MADSDWIFWNAELRQFGYYDPPGVWHQTERPAKHD
jgi:hypothetical protein